MIHYLVEQAFSQRCHRGNVNGALACMVFALAGVCAHAQVCDPFENAKLVTESVNDTAGISVSISGHRAVVGQLRDATNGESSGCAYVFERIGGAWIQQAKLLAFDGTVHDKFGSSVSISGDTILVGAMNDEFNGSFRTGSAYVFTYIGGEWVHQTKLLPTNGVAIEFGGSVSLSGDLAIIGDAYDDEGGIQGVGSASIYSRTGGVWTQEARLVAWDFATGDRFGSSVSISGGTAIIGASGNDDFGYSTGSAYIFSGAEGVWTQQAKFLAGDASGGDYFGSSVSVSGETAIVGSTGDDDFGSSSGSAYLFRRDDGVWIQQDKIWANDGLSGDHFGGSVSIDGQVAIVGASGADDHGLNSGSAYIFAYSEGVWAQQAKLMASDGEARNWFGSPVSISGDTAFVGATMDANGTGGGSNAGYVFDLGCGQCVADMSGDGLLNFVDISVFLVAFGNQELVADIDGDGSFNFLDVSAFLIAFGAGCP